MRAGKWKKPGRPKFPRILGLDGSGVVVAKGKQVRRLAVGDRVWAYDYEIAELLRASYVAVDADNAARIPKRMSLRDGWRRGMHRIDGVPGRRRSCGGTSRADGVRVWRDGRGGSLALQFAKARGARVIATATGRKATELVRSSAPRSAIDARQR